LIDHGASRAVPTTFAGIPHAPAKNGQAKSRVSATKNGIAIRAIENESGCGQQFGRATKRGSGRNHQKAAKYVSAPPGARQKTRTLSRINRAKHCFCKSRQGYPNRTHKSKRPDEQDRGATRVYATCAATRRQSPDESSEKEPRVLFRDD